MNIELLKNILNSKIPDIAKEHAVIQALASDDSVIPSILKIIEQQRRFKSDLINDLNLELSRAHIYIEECAESKERAKQRFNKSFVVDNISAFYIKYQSVIRHCFNRFNP